MQMPDNVPFTDHLVEGQKAFWYWIGDIRPVWIIKVTAKSVKIVEAKESFWRKDEPEISFEAAKKKRGWTLDLTKVRNDLWLNERDYKLFCLDKKRKAIEDLIVNLGKLTTERDELAVELGVEP